MNARMSRVLPVVGLGMAAAAAGAVMMRPKKKTTAAGKAIKAVGEAVESISAAMKM